MSEPTSEPLSDADALVWAVEQHPHQRTTIAALATFRGIVDRHTLRERVRAASDAIPRLRQRVVSTATAGRRRLAWDTEPTADLAHHLRTVSADGLDTADLHDLARDLVVQPFDRARPLWQITHIEGLIDGGSAVLITAHHAVADGVRGVEMLGHLFEPDPRGPAASFDPPHRHRPAPAPRDPIAAVAHDVGASLGAAVRLLRPAAPSPVPRHRSAGLDLRSLTVDLDDLRAAGRRRDGSINDAFVAAAAIGVLDHLRASDQHTLRISVPVDLGTDADMVDGGNHWTPGRLDLTLSARDEPDRVISRVRKAMQPLRSGPSLMGPAAAAASVLPGAAVASIYDAVAATTDLAASNVPGSPTALALCGEPVERLVPFGPLAGSALNLTLLSHATVAEIGISSDPAAINEPDRLADDLRSAFHSVLKGS